MDWNRRHSSVAPASSQNQQCLLVPAASSVANVQSQSGGGQQNPYGQSGQYMYQKSTLIQNLLIAQTAEETLKAKQAALNAHILQPKPQTNQVSAGQYGSSYKPVQETVSKPDAFGVTNPLGSSYRMTPYLSSVQQTPPQQQQQPVQAMHQYNANGYNANGYNANVVQQPVQNSQVLQNYQPNVTYSYPQQNLLQSAQNIYTTARQAANAIQTPCSQRTSKGPSAAMYDLQNGGAGQYISTQKTSADANVSSYMAVNKKGQNVTSATAANYRLSHFNQVPQQLPTVPQMDGNANCYAQSPQRQMLQNGFLKNALQQFSATKSVPAVKMPPAYSQAVTNQSDIFNATSQNFTSQNQNYVLPNVQQPAQASTTLPVQNSAAGQQAELNGIIASHDRKRELLMLLHVYRNVRQKYEVLNRENNLLRERLQANSLENANPPPLISSLPTPPANAVGTEQQNISQALPVQGSPQIGHSNGFQSQNVYENMANASTQQSMHGAPYLKENPVLSNQMCKSESGNQSRQNNYSVFDGGQTSIANGSNSTLQSLNKEPLTTTIYQDVTSKSPMVSTNNLYVPNHSNSKLTQNALGLQSLSKSTSENFTAVIPEKTSSEYLPYSTLGNGSLTSVSREAIEASLPLWKTVPQCSTQNIGSSESQPKGLVVDLTDDTFNLLDEMTFRPTNEVASVVPAQKPDSTISNQANPQIAIVSPLVQTKEALNENCQLSKAQVQGPETESTTVNNLTSARENSCLRKILEVLESIEAKGMNISKTAKSKEYQDKSLDNVTLIPASTEPSPQTEQKPGPDTEIIDDCLQISGICTLVEGSSFYDSSVAMMFEESNKDHLPQTSNITSPKADAVAIKTEPLDNDDESALAHGSEDVVHCATSPDLRLQSDKSIEESSDLTCSSDQLSELLTEFPYGIKNYMSEIKLDNVDGPFVKLSEKPIIDMASVPTKAYEPDTKDHNSSCMDLQSESVPRPSSDLQLEPEKASIPLMDLDPVDEKPSIDLQQTSNSVPVPSLDDKISVPLMDTSIDDSCGIISDSPLSDICITLLDQEDIPKIFPDEHENPVSGICHDIKIEGEEETVPTEDHSSGLHSPEKDNTNAKVEDAPNQTSFCCLFSWLTYTNINAPKCNCEMLESSKEATKDENHKSDAFTPLKTGSSPQNPDPILNRGKTKVSSIVQPSDKPPKLDLIVPKAEILHPMDKPPKLEPVSNAENVQKCRRSSTTQEEINLKRPVSVESVQSPKECFGKSISPVLKHKEPTDKKNKDHSFVSKKSKSDGSPKSEKLVVKTDFLKSKHHPKHKEDMHVSQLVAGDKNIQNGFSKRLEEAEKRLQGAEKVGYKKVAEKAEHPLSQQSEKSLNGSKQSDAVEKSRHSPRGRKRKEKESHFEKTRKVLSVQEYLERKRELCNKKSETRKDSNEGLSELTQMLLKKPSIDESKGGNPKRTSSKTNMSSNTKEVRSKSPSLNRTSKGNKTSREPSETGHRKHKNRSRQESLNKTQDLNSPYSKGKIYLSPCVGPKSQSDDQISLTKLQIRQSPEKPKDSERRESLESYHITPSNVAIKNNQSPKMLEFKLYPEFAHGSPTTQDQSQEAKDLQARSVVEAIKSNKEAWCNAIPLKKRRVESSDGQGITTSPASTKSSSPTCKPVDKNAARSTQDSRSTFNFFKQMYHEQRSKSLDASLGNS